MVNTIVKVTFCDLDLEHMEEEAWGEYLIPISGDDAMLSVQWTDYNYPELLLVHGSWEGLETPEAALLCSRVLMPWEDAVRLATYLGQRR